MVTLALEVKAAWMCWLQRRRELSVERDNYLSDMPETD
jgi:hypothetical protein